MNKMKRKIPDVVCYWIMVIPAIVLVYLFNTRTWMGILGAFQKYVPVKGYFGSKWIGLRNFEIFFKQQDSMQIIRNTLVMAVGKIAGTMFVSIAFALMVNEVRNLRLKKTIQTLVYLPHFVSWVIYATILKSIIGSTGLIEKLCEAVGVDCIPLLGTPVLFPVVMILTHILKEFGWGSIIYLAALTGIDPGLYEAAEIDGANRWQQTLHVSLPGLRHIIVLNGVLSLGGVLNGSFDQIYNMYNTLVMSTADTIDTWVFRQGLLAMNYGVGIAVGLFKSVIALVLTIIAYWAAAKFADYKIF